MISYRFCPVQRDAVSLDGSCRRLRLPGQPLVQPSGLLAQPSVLLLQSADLPGRRPPGAPRHRRDSRTIANSAAPSRDHERRRGLRTGADDYRFIRRFSHIRISSCRLGRNPYRFRESGLERFAAWPTTRQQQRVSVRRSRGIVRLAREVGAAAGGFPVNAAVLRLRPPEPSRLRRTLTAASQHRLNPTTNARSGALGLQRIRSLYDYGKRNSFRRERKENGQ